MSVSRGRYIRRRHPGEQRIVSWLPVSFLAALGYYMPPQSVKILIPLCNLPDATSVLIRYALGKQSKLLAQQEQTMTIQPWRPLLTGAEQQQSYAMVESIAQQLPRAADAVGYAPDLALFFTYLAHAQTEPAAAEIAGERAFAAIEASLERLSTQALSAGLFGGLAGIGWPIAHLADSLLANEDTQSLLQPIDEILLEHVAQSPWTGDYDLISGLVGIGVYARERLPDPAGVQLLETVIKRLAELAEADQQGIAWHTAPQLIYEPQRPTFPNGYYNLGLSHGIPGVIALLGRAVAADVATTTARPLLAGAVRWLLAQDPAPGQGAGEDIGEGGFPAYQHTASERKPARLAWCYGDVGIAAALLSTARWVAEPAWEAAALRIAQRAALRSTAQSGVRDGCLCHGAAGLAHLFNRFYQATGEPLFAQQVRHWLEQTLAVRQLDQGIAGYCFWNQEQGWLTSPGILEGAAGIGLVLLAASSPLEPTWDRMLLIDLPTR